MSSLQMLHVGDSYLETGLVVLQTPKLISLDIRKNSHFLNNFPSDYLHNFQKLKAAFINLNGLLKASKAVPNLHTIAMRTHMDVNSDVFVNFPTISLPALQSSVGLDTGQMGQGQKVNSAIQLT
ncbi:hypothetical protein M422DRAFT_249432 [Sphaerobolus stellatus SS14]|uniref:Unplaced genomic scaffold SPHSTscaffold_29, whole genome shotgun sequence n=1 Tax=Sphaerobolus stellatus (strain SS14) TaxID=990650 RepID=A0A0C9VII9_SPHS4|nr:hypothetical protein M422DRAFT_249432 [Sphaerobolus stellatus SS14]